MPIGEPSLRLSIRLVRKAANAGARLHRAPVAKATRSANEATVAFMEIESMRGMDSGRRCKAVRIAVVANARPSSPPDTLSSRPSQTASRMTTLERAPRASRTAHSRRRRIARTKSRLEALTQAISKTMATAKNRLLSKGRTSATTCSRSSSTSPRI